MSIFAPAPKSADWPRLSSNDPGPCHYRQKARSSPVLEVEVGHLSTSPRRAAKSPSAPRRSALKSDTPAIQSTSVGAEATKATKSRAREPPNCCTTARSRYEPSRLRYPSDLTDPDWKRLSPLIPTAKLRLPMADDPERSAASFEAARPPRPVELGRHAREHPLALYVECREHVQREGPQPCVSAWKSDPVFGVIGVQN